MFNSKWKIFLLLYNHKRKTLPLSLHCLRSLNYTRLRQCVAFFCFWIRIKWLATGVFWIRLPHLTTLKTLISLTINCSFFDVSSFIPFVIFLQKFAVVVSTSYPFFVVGGSLLFSSGVWFLFERLSLSKSNHFLAIAIVRTRSHALRISWSTLPWKCLVRSTLN